MTTLRTPAQLCDHGLAPPEQRAALGCGGRALRGRAAAGAGRSDRSATIRTIRSRASSFPTRRNSTSQPQELSDPIGDDAHSPGRGHRAPLSRPRAAQAHADLRGLLPLLLPPRDGRAGQGQGAVGRGADAGARLYPRPTGYLGSDPHRRRSAGAVGAAPARGDEGTCAASSTSRSLRIHTRVPVAEPARITAELVRAIKVKGKPTYVALHINHPRELTPAARAACARMADAGIPLLGQSVLLDGVNDTPEVLGELMRALVECRIKPYYLHHGDLAPGTAHLRTDIATGQNLMRALRGRLSGLCQPAYVLDIPGGHGKSPIGPNYLARAGSNGTAHFVVEDFNGRPASSIRRRALPARSDSVVPDRQEVEQGRRHRDAGKADEHDGDHGVPDEVHVAPQLRNHILAFHHGLTLPRRALCRTMQI